jgi:hypothetical protein
MIDYQEVLSGEAYLANQLNKLPHCDIPPMGSQEVGAGKDEIWKTALVKFGIDTMFSPPVWSEKRGGVTTARYSTNRPDTFAQLETTFDPTTGETKVEGRSIIRLGSQLNQKFQEKIEEQKTEFGGQVVLTKRERDEMDGEFFPGLVVLTDHFQIRVDQATVPLRLYQATINADPGEIIFFPRSYGNYHKPYSEDDRLDFGYLEESLLVKRYDGSSRILLSPKETTNLMNEIKWPISPSQYRNFRARLSTLVKGLEEIEGDMNSEENKTRREALIKSTFS